MNISQPSMPVVISVGSTQQKPALAAQLAMKSHKKMKSAIAVAKDEECYEDETGYVNMCKKCRKDTQNFVGAHYKYNSMQERVNIVNFLKFLNEKNYAEAHKYLKKVMEMKLAKRIALNKNVELF
jgi:hypothetical protein